MKLKNILKTYLPIVIISSMTFSGLYIYSNYEKFRLKSRSKEGLTLLNSVSFALKATYVEQNSYPLSLEQSGFNPLRPLNYSISLSEDNLDPKIKSLLPRDYLPFVNKNSFRLVVTAELSKNVFHFCKSEVEREAEAKVECVWLRLENLN